MGVLRRVRFLHILAVLMCLAVVARMIGAGTTSGQLPLLLACVLLVAFALAVQLRGSGQRERP